MAVKWKRYLFIFLILVIWLILMVKVVSSRIGGDEWDNPYSDVSESLWSYEYIQELNIRGIFPSEEQFCGDRQETRGNVASYVYRLYLSLGGTAAQEKKTAFVDVDAADDRCEAIRWATDHQLIDGVTDTEFAPDTPITRQEVCTLLMRYAAFAGVKLPAVQDPQQFEDSLEIAEYARSYVTECQVAGLISGYEDNFFRPAGNLSRNECSSILYRLLMAQENPPKAGTAIVSTGERDYDALYESFLPEPFVALVPESSAVDSDWFDQAVFVGDSVTLGLSLYCGEDLGEAKFLCAGSMSARNTLAGIVYPTYQGNKVSVPEGVSLSGAQVVYIMLGMNNITYGVDVAAGEMETLLVAIQEENPDVAIVVESVTPMTKSSKTSNRTLNNSTIQEYNEAMQEICTEHEWYFVNAAEAVTDEEGYLKSDYSSDAQEMGIHMNSSGAAVWIAYLKSHVPEALK